MGHAARAAPLRVPLPARPASGPGRAQRTWPASRRRPPPQRRHQTATGWRGCSRGVVQGRPTPGGQGERASSGQCEVPQGAAPRLGWHRPPARTSLSSSPPCSLISCCWRGCGAPQRPRAHAAADVPGNPAHILQRADRRGNTGMAAGRKPRGAGHGRCAHPRGAPGTRPHPPTSHPQAHLRQDAPQQSQDAQVLPGRGPRRAQQRIPPQRGQLHKHPGLPHHHCPCQPLHGWGRQRRWGWPCILRLGAHRPWHQHPSAPSLPPASAASPIDGSPATGWSGWGRRQRATPP